MPTVTDRLHEPRTGWRRWLRLHAPAPGDVPPITALPVFVALCGLFALAAPLAAGEEPLERVGGLLLLTGIIEILHAIRRTGTTAVRRAMTSGAITMLMALLVLNSPYLASGALVIFVGASFAIDGVGYASDAWHANTLARRRLGALAAVADFATIALLMITRRYSPEWSIAIGGSLRAFGVAWAMATAPVYGVEDAHRTIVEDLDLSDHPEAVALGKQVAAEEAARARSDRGWIISFVITLFAIHVARIRPDGTLLGLVSPAVATAGDMLLAMLIALMVLLPVILSLRRSTRWLERLVWRWYLASAAGHGWLRATAAWWLRYRLRMAMRLREARYSLPAALQRSLAAGLPAAAIIAATAPIWGMSWFFDTENWTSGLWNSWAEARTDVWREAMTRAVAGDAITAPATFAIVPPGTAHGDFSFIVIGDTGEGDASQHVLHDQLLAVSEKPDVRFVLLSSDVIYPNGAMTDYEAKFWLPFKGVTKPVYAIPGNHDWYDALEAFLATFLEPDAARVSMRARVEADLRLTSTTDGRIDGLIAEAQRLRGEYGVPTGFQRGPFFELQGDRFALVAVDTGIVKRIDDAQWAWLEAALNRSRGKFTMAVLGHPFYAEGQDGTSHYADFARLKALMLAHDVDVLMAGDTHSLQYYFDPPQPGRHPAHYFVNGGGGAYLTLGAALQWPKQPPTKQWGYYPDHDAIVQKMDARMPWWKRPAWWWTKQFDAWPFSAAWLSAAFDSNQAPFFQSFVEVRVEPSAGRVRVIPYGVHGRLRWREVAHSAGLGERGDDLVEWLVPMP